MMNTANTSSNFCFVGKRDGLAKRGSYVVGRRFAKLLNCDFKNDTDIKDINNDLGQYKKILFLYQRCNNYSFEFNIKDIISLPHVIFTRDKNYAKLFNSATNGFSVYHDIKMHNNFIPWITDINLPSDTELPKEITIGFYERININPDAIRYLQNEINECRHPINLVTCGDNVVSFEKVQNHYHTYDNIDFFSKITHYYFPQSAVVMDVFPHTLLEAIQLNKQIICPKIQNRSHKDGIDDILELLSGYHSKLEDAYNGKWYDYKGQILTANMFSNFYKKLVKSDFSYNLEYNKYKTFYDWCSHEL